MRNFRFPTGIINRYSLAVFIILVMAAVFKFSFYLYGLNKLIDGAFPLHQGSPSNIYARPLEIRPGMPLAPADLEWELRLLRYRNRPAIDAPGSYEHRSDAFTIYTRAFKVETAQSDLSNVEPKRVRVSFVQKQKQVASITDLSSGEHLKQVGLEPLKIGRLSNSDVRQHEFVGIHMIPQLLIKSIIAVEDQHFYNHRGADFRAVLRAIWVNLSKGYVAQGGSTITQQLARHLFFSREQTLERKIDETITAFILELRLSKAEIMEAYINEVYLGQDGKQPIRGFSAAGDYYFGKSISDLDLNEIALLVGMLKGPSSYNPIKYPQRARHRRDLVLQIMSRRQLVSYEQARAAVDEAVSLYVPQDKITFPAVVDLARRHYKRYYDAGPTVPSSGAEQGIRIMTTCDPIIQLKVEAGIREGFGKIEKRHNISLETLETGVVVISLASNHVLAVVGGRDFRFDGFNRAVDARRPIGSLIKPAYFLAALEQPEVYNLMTRLDNSPLDMELAPGRHWTPKNYSKGHQGEVPLYKALSQSYNIASVRLGMALGLDYCIDAIHKLGFERRLQPYPAILLGSMSMSPLEVAQIYQTFGLGGRQVPIRVIANLPADDRNATRTVSTTGERRFDQDAVYLLNIILQKAVSEGTINTRVRTRTKNLHAAGKTGTTDDLRDNWFAGFSGDKLTVVWVGKDQYAPAMLTGAQGAFVIWDEIMARIAHIPFAPKMSSNIEWVDIDPHTGFKIEERVCEAAQPVPYISGFTPGQTITCRETKQSGRDTRPFNQWLKGVLN
jgi:penicillin-binding protein 1B